MSGREYKLTRVSLTNGLPTRHSGTEGAHGSVFLKIFGRVGHTQT